MDIKIRKDDNLRINADEDNKNFIDIHYVGYKSLAIDLYGMFTYIEVREKEKKVRVFNFIKKSHKKEHTFGWWEDAKVVYSMNCERGLNGLCSR